MGKHLKSPTTGLLKVKKLKMPKLYDWFLFNKNKGGFSYIGRNFRLSSPFLFLFVGRHSHLPPCHVATDTTTPHHTKGMPHTSTTIHFTLFQTPVTPHISTKIYSALFHTSITPHITSKIHTIPFHTRVTPHLSPHFIIHTHIHHYSTLHIYYIYYSIYYIRNHSTILRPNHIPSP